MRVFPDVEPVVVPPFGRDDAGIADTVPVVGLRAGPGAGHCLVAVGREMSRDHADRQVATGLQPLLPGDGGELQDVVGEADDRRGPEAVQQLDLLVRAGLQPGSGRQQHGADEMQDRLADVVAAIDHSEAVDRMDDVPLAHALQPVRPRQKGVLHLAIPGAEEQRLRGSRGSAGRVHDHAAPAVGPVDAVEVAIGRMRLHARHQVRFREARQLRQVVDAPDVAGLDAGLPPEAAIEGNLPAAPHQAGKPPFLQRAKLVRTDPCGPAQERLADRVFRKDPVRIRLVEVPGRHVSRPLSRADTDWPRPSAARSRSAWQPTRRHGAEHDPGTSRNNRCGPAGR